MTSLGRRSFLKSIGLGVLGLSAHGVLSKAFADSHVRKPNIVFILADDAGYGDLSCYGAEKYKTPNLDRLAREGMRFTDAHSPSAVCTPSRYAFMTGRYGWRSWTHGEGLNSNDPLLIKPDQMTTPMVLKSAGYRTGMVGKWHLGFGREGNENFDSVGGIDWNGRISPGPLECGFDSFFGIPMVGQLPHIMIRDHKVVGVENLDKAIEFVPSKRNPDYNVAWYKRPDVRSLKGPWFEWANTEPIKYEHEDLALILTNEATSFIEKQDGEEPFFLYFAHRNPHVPWRPNEQFKGTTDFKTDSAQRYGEFMVELDWSVGQVLEQLERKGLADDTLVIFSSDNGGALFYTHVDRANREGHFCNGPLRGQKTDVYEGGNRIPFIVRWPGVVEGGTTNDSLIANVDLMATFAELSDVNLPEGAGPDSISFLHELTGDASGKAQREYLIVDSPNGLLAVRKGPWKYIPAQGQGGFRWQPYSIDYSKPPAQLYNLDEDIAESNNLYYKHPEIAQELHDYLAKEARKRDPVPTFL